jgi:FtsP/CotA-like multicopper oxidase with cupredoxin domain
VLDRRSFLSTAAASVGAFAAAGLLGCVGREEDEEDIRTVGQAAGKPGGSTRNPIKIPSAVSPAGLTLAAAPAVASLGGAFTSNVWAYNASFPAPTIRAATGDNVSVQLTNNLSEETTIHWHGMLVPTPADGHPMDVVAPGGTYDYQFPIVQRACMNWYHPHPHMMTGMQVALGLAGAFIINDSEEAALGLPAVPYEVPLILRDANLDSQGNITYNPTTSGYLGRVPMVNGTRDARLDVDTALYRFRILNGANARVFRLALSDGSPFLLIGNDGGLLATATSVAQITMGPGERVDVLVDFRNKAVGSSVMLQDLDAAWDLLQFSVTNQVSVPATLPTTLSTITPLESPVTTRNFSFDGMSRINGLEYDMARVDFQVPFGTVEKWVFTTAGNAPHPVHVHGASFQVLSRTGGRGALMPWESGWKDTVLLQDFETVEVLIRFNAYRGMYLMHCHKLEHEDMGMMSNFEVV